MQHLLDQKLLWLPWVHIPEKATESLIVQSFLWKKNRMLGKPLDIVLGVCFYKMKWGNAGFSF